MIQALYIIYYFEKPLTNKKQFNMSKLCLEVKKRGKTNMLETIYKFNSSNDKLIEKLVENSILAINHIVLPPLDVLPEHISTANLYLIILGGNITLKLGQQQLANYTKGNIINIPLSTMMKIENQTNELLEFIVIKSLA